MCSDLQPSMGVQSSPNVAETELIESQVQKSRDEIDSAIANVLKDNVPEKAEVSVPPIEAEKGEVIHSANEEAIGILNHAKLVAINVFMKNEEGRTKRQMPLLIIISITTFLLLAAFYAIVFYLVKLSFQKLDDFSLLFDVLKYFIGATVVEMIGLLAFITKATFSNDHLKIMEYLFGGDQDGDDYPRSKKQEF